MKASIEVELAPFSVPNYVRVIPKQGTRVDTKEEAPCYALDDLDAVTLQRLCDEFCADVFRKAGKQPPPGKSKP